MRQVDAVKPHLNSDNLELLEILGWQVVAKIGEYKQGDKLIFVPPDCLIPYELAKKLSIVNYLAIVKDNVNVLRVKSIRLRGEPSYGLTVNPNSVGLSDIEVNTDVAERLGITKWEEPVKSLQGNQASEKPLFHKYTDLENFNNYPNIIEPEDYIIVTEKTDGTNFRVGLVKTEDENGNLTYELMAGSHNVRRYRDDSCRYWRPVLDKSNNLEAMINCLHKEYNDSVIVFGEIFGKGVKKLDYGTNETFRLFDISVGGQYLDYPTFKKNCDLFDIKTMPVLYEGYFDLEKIKELTDGDSVLSTTKQIREGIVIRLNEERTHPKVGRICFKRISVDYLASKKGHNTH